MAAASSRIQLWEMLKLIEIREMPLGHSIGLWDAYYRPTPEQCLNAYLKVVEDLTINKENRLAKQVHELKTKKEDSEYIIKGKLREMMEKSQEKFNRLKFWRLR